jgi:hypothetical protein
MASAPGDRVELVATDDPYTRLRPGDRGTVTGVWKFPEPAIDVQWDDGSTLSVLPGAGDHTGTHAGPAAAPPTTTRPPAGQPGNPAELTGHPAAEQAAPPSTSRRFLPATAVTHHTARPPRRGPHQTPGGTNPVGTRSVIARRPSTA